jgi:hypothetical protein
MAHFGRPSLGGRGLGKAAHLPLTKEVYSFPILPPAEIIEVLREMGVVVSEDDINKPKADQFRQVCELFVMEILGISKEEMYSPQADFVARLGDTADLHEESVPVVHFMRNMCVRPAAARHAGGVRARARTRLRLTRCSSPHLCSLSRAATRSCRRPGATRASRSTTS